MFAIMGITGKVGGAVADTLLKHGKKVRGIVRDASKARTWQDNGVEIVTSNYDHHLTLAFSGVEGVFVMIPPNLVPEPGFPEDVVRIAAIKKAILAAKPRRAVLLSSWGSEKSSGLGLIALNRILEQELGDTVIPSAFLRPAWFMENLGYSLSAARSTGNYFSFYQPLERPYAMVATKDIGRIGAQTLLEDWQGNRGSRFPAPCLTLATMLLPLSQRRSAAPSPRWPFPATVGWTLWPRTACPLIVPVLTSKWSTV
jgi:NAD(P)H dehydrogenase (quinone)